MAQPPEDKKPDFSSLPRGAIGIKGFPVSRNTRLPSIRGPRDLTLVTLPKKTFMPNIPVRREKKPPVSEGSSQQNQENVKKFDQKKGSPQSSDRGRGRGRGRAQIIQTTGAIFSEGIAQDPSIRKEKMREAYQKSEYSTPRGMSVKKEKDNDVGDINRKMDDLLRDDFIDDGEDDDVIMMRPTIFPATAEIKKETKIKSNEPTEAFDPNIAKEVGFDVNKVAKFIKKEKGTEVEENSQSTTSTETVFSSTNLSSNSQAPTNDIKDLLHPDSNSSPKLVLLQFPEFVSQKIEDSDSNRQSNSDPKISDNQTPKCASIKTLPEGCIGKLKIMKSGKAKLTIGSIELNLDTIDIFHSRHEVVCIRTDSNFGNLDTLGYVDHKVKFVPDEDSLIS